MAWLCYVAIYDVSSAVKISSEEQIRHELQSVAEGVAASVLLPPIPFASVLSERERDESFPETNQDGEVLQNDEETQTTLVQVNLKSSDSGCFWICHIGLIFWQDGCLSVSLRLCCSQKPC